MPYLRDEKLVRPWAIPGFEGLEHRIGGIEKEDITGNISYDPDNHEHMVKTRAAKVDNIADYIPLQQIDNGTADADVLILGWGGTYGALRNATAELLAEGKSVAHAHVRYMHPLPKNLETLLRNHKHVLIPELNNGQLIKIIRDKFLIDAKGLNKIQGLPFYSADIKNAVYKLLN
jgi:2-oxoglutarate ferredoxin oxidoreductase subunit alpha